MLHGDSLCAQPLRPLPLSDFSEDKGQLYTGFTKTNHHVQNLMERNILFPILPIRGENIFVFFFSASAVSRQNFLPITGIKEMISGIAFDLLSSLRALLYDRFKIYTIFPIVRMETNSIQAIEVVPIVQVVCDRPGNVSI